MEEKQKLNQLENFVADHEILMQSINKRLSMVENVGTIIGFSVISAGAIITMIILLITKGVF